MSKHTPGPWSLSASGLRTNDGAIAVLHYSAESQDCTHIAYITCQAKFKRGQGWNAECAVRDANAHLIAAAPELLSELVKLRRAYVNLLEAGKDRITSLGGECDPVDMMERSDPALTSARAAIAKATGGAA